VAKFEEWELTLKLSVKAIDMPAPEISVIIPVFNRPELLRRALQSLRNQTCQNFEVIICDHGSTESMNEVIGEFRPDLNLTFIKAPQQGGVGFPRNRAIEVTSSDWVAFLDSDDWWGPKKIEAVLPLLKNEVDFIYHKLGIVRELGGVNKRATKGRALQFDFLTELVAVSNPIPNSSVVVRKSCLEGVGGFDENRFIIEDFDLWVRLAQQGLRAQYINEVLGYYWVSEKGISTVSEFQLESHIQTYQKLLPTLPISLQRQAYAKYQYTLAILKFKLGRPRESWKHLLAAKNFQTHQQGLKKWLALGYIVLIKGFSRHNIE
jgi:glycosyltransferase involved in cell wall biosynthesis